MGELQKKMLMKMELRNLSKRTIGIYLFHMRRFVKYYGISPDKLGVSEVEEYLHTFYENKKSISSLVQAHGAIKFFYKEVLGKEEVVSKILRPKIEKKIPVVLSKEEVKKILESVNNYRSQTVLMSIYSAGLRLSEALNLRITDIDSQRMGIRIEQGKGKKDRNSILSKTLLERLREYYRIYHPKNYLFYGKTGKPLNGSTIQRAFNEAKKKRRYQRKQQFIPCAIVLQHIF